MMKNRSTVYKKRSATTGAEGCMVYLLRVTTAILVSAAIITAIIIVSLAIW